MKKCSYCGQSYPDDATNCAIDDQPLVDDRPQNPGLKSADFHIAPSSASMSPVVSKVKRHANSLERFGWVFFIIGVAAFGAALLGGFSSASDSSPPWLCLEIAGACWGTCITFLFYAQLLHIRAALEK